MTKKNDEFIRVRLPAEVKARYAQRAADTGFTRKRDGDDVGDVSKWIRAVLDADQASHDRAVALAADRERLAYHLCVLLDLYGERFVGTTPHRDECNRAAVALIDMNFGEPGSPRARSFVELGEPGRKR